MIEPAAAQLLDDVLADEDNAHLRAPRWQSALRNWSTLQARADRFGEHLDALGVEEQMQPPRGGARSPVETWVGLVKAATNAADRIGLNPASNAKLARDLASAHTMSALGARHPLRAALERISEQRAIETTGEPVEAVIDEQGASDGD